MEIIKVEIEKLENGIRVIEYHEDNGKVSRKFSFKPNPISIGVQSNEEFVNGSV